MVKVSPEVKRIADKYCDENRGPPRKVESVDSTALKGQEFPFIWLDEFHHILPTKPKEKYREQISPVKIDPMRPWLKFKELPLNPKRKRR